jgi:hypothetical protein
MEQKQPNDKGAKVSFPVGLILGLAIGTAIDVSTGNLAVGIGTGIALALAFGFYFKTQGKK